MKPTKRKPAVERRDEIARAVLRIIGERGLTSLTIATIAAEVGVTNGALYRHFASLDEILEETVRHGVERIDATFPDPSLPPVERLLALAGNRVTLLGGDPGLAWLLRSEQVYLSLAESRGPTNPRRHSSQPSVPYPRAAPGCRGRQHSYRHRTGSSSGTRAGDGPRRDRGEVCKGSIGAGQAARSETRARRTRPAPRAAQRMIGRRTTIH